MLQSAQSGDKNPVQRAEPKARSPSISVCAIVPDNRIEPTGKFGHKRAVDYIEANLAEPISVVDICRHSGLGIRTLQRQFVRELGVSPSRYVLARRLNAARQRLIGCDPGSKSVTAVALEHGFTHLGRFAGTYRAFFGETPRQTLFGKPVTSR